MMEETGARPWREDSGSGWEILYRGGFSGFLCAVDESLRRGPEGGLLPPIRAWEGGRGLFDESQVLDTDRARAREFWERLRKVSAPAAKTCFAAYCSDRKNREGVIARVIVRILAEGPEALEDLGDGDVTEILAASRRSLGEAHKFCGLLRFRELKDSSWYAAIRPDCDILPFIGDHFSTRFRIMRFVIHDRGRFSAILHEPGKPWQLVQGFGLREEGNREMPLPVSPGEEEIREGWLRYFKSVALEPRRNPRLQASHMPKKYWEFLPETQPSPAPGGKTCPQNAGTKLPL
jgi:probable DNA metabolism protein